MISIRDITYEISEAPEKSFSRLKWAVEKVDSLTRQLLTNLTKTTSRPWIGKLNEESLKFSLIEPSNFWIPRFFHVVIRGSIKETKDGSIVRVKFKLGWYALMVALMVLLFTLMMVSVIMINPNLESILSGLFWLTMFPGLGAFLLFKKLNKVEKKLDDLFDK